jgi:hypothetical protein
MDIQELNQYILDPSKSISFVLDRMSEDSNNKLSFQDPTHPAINILEASAFMASACLNKINTSLRDVFPILANSNENLYKHISDADIIGVSSSPSTISVVFYIKKIDIEQLGVEYDGFRKCAIPLYTNIKVDNIDFTLLNRINIFLFDNGKIDIEQELSPGGLGIDSIFRLESLITVEEEAEWVVFETLVKQVKRSVIEESIISGKKFEKSIPISNGERFHFTEVYAINSDDSRIKLETVYNDQVFNKNTPSIFVKFLDGELVYDLPMIYQAEGILNSKLEIILYTTKGEMSLPTEILENNKFEIKLGETTDLEASSIENINKFCVSRGMATYGNNGKDMAEIKNSVIFNTTGKISTPITTAEFKDAASREGFFLEIIRDTVTTRNFVVNRALPEPTMSSVKTKADILNNQVSIQLDEANNYNNISISNNDIVLKANSSFKYKNGIVSMLTNLEVFNLEKMPRKNLIAYLNENEIFYNPFTYIIEKDAKIIKSRVYNLNNPKLINLKVSAKNNYVSVKVNIVAMDVLQTKDGYTVRFKVSGNDDFNNLRPAFVKAQLKIPLNNAMEYVYFTESLFIDGADNKYFIFNISSNLMIDSDNGISVLNGNSLITTKTIGISGKMFIDIYSIDNQIVKDINHSSMDDKIMIEDKEFLNVLTLEELDYTFGQELKYIWNNVINFYTDRKFKKHTEDSFARYQNDVYEYCEETESIFWPVRDLGGNITRYEERILNRKGDIIEDVDGNKVYAFKKGDYVTDENGNLILDGTSGIVRAVDVLMIDYKFKVAGKDYPNYTKEFTNTIVTWINNAITTLNKSSLDQTLIQFKSNKNVGTVKLISNGLTSVHNSIVIPSVVLYLNSSLAITADIVKVFKDTIGKILHKHIESRSFTISDIRNNIITELGSNVLGVKISKITNDDREIVTVAENSNVFTLSKELFTDNDNNIDMTYNIDLKIEN